jgi:hypothetical protein
VIAAALLVGLTVAAPARVAVFPFEARGLDPRIVRALEPRIVEALGATPDLELRGVDAISTELGVDLSAQVAACGTDVLCLAQLGELVGVEKVLVGSVREEGGRTHVRLSTLDVARAALADTLRWEVPRREGALVEASLAAARQLLAPPDTTLILDVHPRDAKVSFYGDAAPERSDGPVAFWSGVYYVRAERAGYEPRDVRVTLPPGGPTRVQIELEGDPLWVDPSRPPPRETELVRAPPPAARPEASSAFANLWAWSVVAAGVGASVAGAAVMAGAQSDYNTLAGETRYLDGVTRSSLDARSDADAAASSFGTGRLVAGAGAGVAVLGLGWMIVDALIGAPEPAR